MCVKKSHYVSILLFTLVSQNLFAESAAQHIKNTPSSTESLCPTYDSSAAKHVKPRTFTGENIDNTEISADFTESSTDGSTDLDGNVIIEQNTIRVKADHANYNTQSNQIYFSGNVHIDTESMSLDADNGTVSMDKTETSDNTQGTFNNIKFFIPESNMKGQAEVVNATQKTDAAENRNISVLNNASITSCDLFDPDWLISADEIKLDHDDEYGTADDVVIRFKNVPFMYVPYMEFPTSNKRRSGLLFPEFGTSSSRGVELAAPWYWNIAPNHDAVLTPRLMEKRGLELGGNYRYLTQSTRGTLKGTYLPTDKITQEKRYQYRYQQRSKILSNLYFNADIQDISDSEYFNDFSNSLGTTSQTHLYRNASLNYNLQDWRMKVLLQDIKTIDDTTPIASRPYERLPQLTFLGETEIASSAVFFTFDSEYVDFTHEDETKLTGSRLTVRPGLRLPLSGAAWFLTPAVKFSHTQYDVGTDGNPANLGTSQTVEDLTLPISSIDAGLFFEKPLGNGFQQTLEPRLYYLNVPFRDQSNTPLFDTSTPNFSVSQLFRDNRFIGGDRVGDANQLTLALTSRILNTNSGSEFLRASIGQIFYFEDRQVSLNGTTTNDTEKRSDVIGEFRAKWENWQGNVNLQWDTENSRLSQDNYFLHYKSDAQHLFNIGYRKRLVRNSDAIDIEQTDTSFVYAFNSNYSGIARWNYSLKDRKGIDTIVGIAYDSCCWSIQLLGQRRIQNTSTAIDAYNNSILIQFVFKGLGSLSGSKARTTLRQSIYGYTDPFQE
ncbi:LPS-assembly protein LptD @ Organic solvent tolerance protein precursor [hydrothermal vent metagenome]|uniref:LPS-assembly protein LptD @ Organic solvent tolerance protein n=1 Tax=hydrothermal vent metagenome TaxID=652676 RepID=A0A3B0WH73_9ZZZZ